MNLPCSYSWLLFGLSIDKLPIILPNIIEVVLLGTVLVLKRLIPDTIKPKENISGTAEEPLIKKD